MTTSHVHFLPSADVPQPKRAGGGLRAEPKPHRRRPRLRCLLALLLAFALGAASGIGGVAWWATHRYIVDDVAIQDVEAFEDELGATSDLTNRSMADSGEVASDDAASGAQTSTAAPSIKISEMVVDEGDSQVTYYVTDVQLSDVTQLRGGFANNQFGQNIIADTSEIAEKYDASFALNGDYYGFRDSGIVIRNGILFRDEPTRTGLTIHDDGTMRVVFIVVDGRSQGYSRGVTMTEFAQIFQTLGATIAYNLDGGGSATMVADGELVNNPLGRNDERGTSDILHLGVTP